ncbi:hypothetical protein MLD38_007182 [Melastoma candidum]|uniref:Uncharacterized protein n=1 Tax=Melastoma candidum TaxID=119954 RepID=A0ACB9RYU3_9MYRT|nr:hypothetical protein MLD38_007182 [Melastoma candidum]
MLSSIQQGGPTLALIKEVPWSARRGNLSEKSCVLKTVKWILNKLTPEKFGLLQEALEGVYKLRRVTHMIPHELELEQKDKERLVKVSTLGALGLRQ